MCILIFSKKAFCDFSIFRASLFSENRAYLFSVLQSHTARRSFATNLYKRKVPTITIMAVTGHKTEKSFLKYIKVTPTEHAEMIREVWREKPFVRSLFTGQPRQ